jgi:hypothetical protein
MANNFIKYIAAAGEPDFLSGEPTAQAGEFYPVALNALCGEPLAQAGEPECLAGNFSIAVNESALSVTDTADAVSITGTVATLARLDTVEPVDAVAATITSIITADMVSTEAPDAVIISMQNSAPRERTFIAAPYSRTAYPQLHVNLKLKEAPDVAVFAVEQAENNASLTTGERPDRIRIDAKYTEDFYNESETMILILAIYQSVRGGK